MAKSTKKKTAPAKKAPAKKNNSRFDSENDSQKKIKDKIVIAKSLNDKHGLMVGEDGSKMRAFKLKQKEK